VAKRKTIERINEELGPCVICADDVAAMAEILRGIAGPNDRFSMSVPGFALDEAADFETLEHEPLDVSLHLSLADSPHDVVVYFGGRFPADAYAPAIPSARGALMEIKNHLDAHCRPTLYSLLGAKMLRLWLPLALAAQLVAVHLLVNRVASPTRDLVGAATFIACAGPFLYLVFARRRCWIHTTTRKARPKSFWQSHRDKILASVITGVLVGVTMLVIGRGCTSAAAFIPASGASAQSSVSAAPPTTPSSVPVAFPSVDASPLP
jgi:hypothetical protein